MIDRRKEIPILPIRPVTEFQGAGELRAKSGVAYFDNFGIVIFGENPDIHLIRPVYPTVIKE
jgi:hypothetical protein